MSLNKTWISDNDMIFVDLTNPSYQVWILAAIQQGMCRYHQPVISEVATCHSITGYFCFCLILVTINELIIMPDISRSHQPVISGVSTYHSTTGYVLTKHIYVGQSCCSSTQNVYLTMTSSMTLPEHLGSLPIFRCCSSF